MSHGRFREENLGRGTNLEDMVFGRARGSEGSKGIKVGGQVVHARVACHVSCVPNVTETPSRNRTLPRLVATLASFLLLNISGNP